MTCDFQKCGTLISEESDEPVSLLLSLETPMMFGQWPNSHRIFKRLANALISLRVCAGWLEHLVIAHTSLLKISCCGSDV